MIATRKRDKERKSKKDRKIETRHQALQLAIRVTLVQLALLGLFNATFVGLLHCWFFFLMLSPLSTTASRTTNTYTHASTHKCYSKVQSLQSIPLLLTVGGDRLMLEPRRSCGPMLECRRIGSPPPGVPPKSEGEEIRAHRAKQLVSCHLVCTGYKLHSLCLKLALSFK